MPNATTASRLIPRPRANGHPLGIALLLAVLLTAMAAACAADPEPRIEEFPSLILGRWQQVGGPIGTLSFEGSTKSGIGTRSAEGIASETFTYQWVAPAQIRTNLKGDITLTVLFEDRGDTLVLATAADANASAHEIIRYSRLK